MNESSESSGTKSNRSIKLVCSDDAVGRLGDFVEQRMRSSQFNPAFAEDTKRVDRKQLDAKFQSDNTLKHADEIQPKRHEHLGETSDIEILRRIFKKDGAEWKLDEIYLNASGKGEYGKRLTFLFLYLNELEGTPKVSRSHLNKVLEDATVYDGNLKHWLANEAAINHEGDLLSLNAAGRRAAKAHMQDASNERDPNQWLPGANSTKRNSGKSGQTLETDEKEPVRRSGRRNIGGKKLVGLWKALNLSIDAHNLFAARSDCDKGLLAMWAIRKATSDAIKEVSSQGMSTFLYEAFELQIHKRSLERGLKSDSAKGLAIHRKGTTFQILPPGIKHVEEALKI